MSCLFSNPRHFPQVKHRGYRTVRQTWDTGKPKPPTRKDVNWALDFLNRVRPLLELSSDERNRSSLQGPGEGVTSLQENLMKPKTSRGEMGNGAVGKRGSDATQAKGAEERHKDWYGLRGGLKSAQSFGHVTY